MDTMLRRFEVTGFRGPGDRMSLDLTRTRGYSFNGRCVEDGTVLKSVLYGGNMSGKSALCSALYDLRTVGRGIGGTTDRPARFSYEFLSKGRTVTYRYRRDGQWSIWRECLDVDGEVLMERRFTCETKGSGLADAAADPSHPGHEAASAVMGFANRIEWLEHFRIPFDHVDLRGPPALMEELSAFRSGISGNCREPGARFDKSVYRLMELFFALRHVEGGGFLIADDVDELLDDRAARNVLERIVGLDGVQAMVSTRNARLVSNDLLRPDCFLIVSDGIAHSLPDLTDRELREGHNLGRMILNGEFETPVQTVDVSKTV